MSQALSDRDLAMFEGIRVPVDLLLKAGIRRITHSESCGILGINGSGDSAGVLFPYLDPVSGRRVTARVRRDHPDVDEHGKLRRKYLSPFGDRRHLYFLPGANPLLDDVSVPVIAVEAEKSALALTALSKRTDRPLLVFACGGCWGWRGRIGISESSKGERIDQRGPLPDFGLVTWQNRDAFICFDSNSRSNPKVQQAQFALAKELLNRGARVRVVELPEGQGVNGPDDYIGACGDIAFLALVDSARLLHETLLADANKALAVLANNPAVLQDQTSASKVLNLVAAIDDPEQRKVLETRSAKVLQWPARDVRNGVAKRIAAQRQSKKAAEEAARRSYLRAKRLDPTTLVDKLEAFFIERAYLPNGAALVFAYFSLNTWVFELFDSTPYLLLESATPGCGKTAVLTLLESVCSRSRMLASVTEAAMFRLIDQERPTILLDEAELLTGRGERAEYIRAIANAGYKQGGTVPRCVGDGHELQNFRVYCPKAFAAIGGMTGALLDRCIVVHMEKSPAGHKRIPIRGRLLRKHSAMLRESLEAYAEQYRDRLVALHESEPDVGFWPELGDREAELWGPLLTHAKLLGLEQEKRLLKIALEFSCDKLQIETQDRDMALAIELLECLGKLDCAEFLPRDLVSRLDGDWWGERLSRCIDDRAKAAVIGRFLSRFRLKSKTHTRTGTGYRREEAIAVLTAHTPGRTFTTITSVTTDTNDLENRAVSYTVTNVTDVTGDARRAALHPNDMGDRLAPAAGQESCVRRAPCVYPEHSASDWQRPDGGWACGICHPDPRLPLASYNGA